MILLINGETVFKCFDKVHFIPDYEIYANDTLTFKINGQLYERNWFAFRHYHKSDCFFTCLGKVGNSSIKFEFYESGLAHLGKLVHFY